MITEKQIRLEMEIGYDLLSSHLEIRNKIIDMIMRQYKDQLYSPSDIQDWYGIEEWKDTEERFQSLRFYHAEDFIPYQSYLPQIFAYHKQYLSLDHLSKVEMLETLFLNRFYAYITPRARLELLRELGNLYCQKHGIEPCKVLGITWLPNQASMANSRVTLENGDTISYIVVSKDIMNHPNISGVRTLECIYHELDHFYLEQKAQCGKLSKEESIAYISSFMNQLSLLQQDAYIRYMFLPVEYRAIVQSYQKVSQILKSNPYANEKDESWWKENQYIVAKKLLLDFNIEHQVYLTERQMTEFRGSIAIEQFERENGNCQLSLEKEECKKYKEKAKKFRMICESQK